MSETQPLLPMHSQERQYIRVSDWLKSIYLLVQMLIAHFIKEFFLETHDDNVPIPFWPTTCKLLFVNPYAFRSNRNLNVIFTYMLAFAVSSGGIILTVCGSSFSTVGIIGIIVLIINRLSTAMGLAASMENERKARIKAEEERVKAEEERVKAEEERVEAKAHRVKIEAALAEAEADRKKMSLALSANGITCDTPTQRRYLEKLCQDANRKFIANIASQFDIQERYDPFEHLTERERSISTQLSGTE